MNPEYRIAMFGSKSSGKTVYLTTLYSHGGNHDDTTSAHVLASGDPTDNTHVYLMGAYTQLCNRKWPDATALEKLKPVNLTITSAGTQSRVSLPDVAGEITERLDAVKKDTSDKLDELKQKIFEEFAKYDGFFIFAPCNESGHNALQHKMEVDLLLEYLKERSKDHVKITRPIAVIASKWDQVNHSATSPEVELEKPETELEKAKRVFEKNYSATANALSNSCENWKVFPVSSTGAPVDDMPPDTLRPRGVAAPVIWLLRTAEKAALKRADEYVEQHKNHLFKHVKNQPTGSKPPTFAANAITRYESILAKRPPEPIRAEAQNSADRLRSLTTTRRNQRRCIAASAVMVMMLIGWTLSDFYVDRSLRRNLIGASKTSDSLDPALQQARRFVNSDWHMPAKMLGWKQSLARLADTRQSDWEKSWDSTIISATYPDNPGKALKVAEDGGLFEERFPDSESLVEVKQAAEDASFFLGNLEATRLLALYSEETKMNLDQLTRWIADAKRFVQNSNYASSEPKVPLALDGAERQLANIRSDQEWEKFKLTYSELADQPWQQYLAAQQWLSEHPESSHIEAAQKLVVQSLASADDKAWNQITHRKARFGSDYRALIQLANEYISNTEFDLHQEEAEKFRTDQLDRWDQQTYREIQDATKSELSDERIDTIESRCQRYLDSTERPIKMQSEVEKWLNWHKKISEGIQAVVKVDSIKIGRNSRFHGYTYYPDVFVTVSVNGLNDRTDSIETNIDMDTKGIPNDALGPFTWQRGDEQVAVAITCTDYTSETVDATLEKDGFMLRQLNGPVSFDGGKIIVRLSCPAAIPPDLPSYH